MGYTLGFYLGIPQTLSFVSCVVGLRDKVSKARDKAGHLSSPVTP